MSGPLTTNAAARIISLGSDFLAAWPGHLRYVRDFAARRGASSVGVQPEEQMNRLYVVEHTDDYRRQYRSSFLVKPAEMLNVAVTSATRHVRDG